MEWPPSDYWSLGGKAGSDQATDLDLISRNKADGSPSVKPVVRGQAMWSIDRHRRQPKNAV